MPSREAAFRDAYQAMLRLWTVAPEAREVSTAGARTHVQTWGDPSAPPLVLLHGFQVTSTMWAPNAAAIGAVRRVFAPDTPADYGLSTAARRPRNVDDLMTWLDELLDGLGLGEVDLGGMSYGGWLSAHYAARRPERVRKLVLVAPATTFGRFSAAFMLRGLPMVLWKRRQFVDAYLRWAGVPGDARYDALMNALVDVMYTGSRHFGSLGLPLPRPIPAETLRRIQAPTLLLYGDREKMHRPDAAVTFARAHVARLEPHVLTDASHDLTLRQPGAVDQAIVSFLTRRVESP